jgi:quercetin dioxygenase-like cupin family protein
MEPGIFDGASYETVRFPTDEIRLRVTKAGGVQVAEYTSEDREGPPAHSHPWDEIEYVIEGEAEFFMDGTWTRGGPGSVQMLPAGVAHSVRVPSGTARLLMVTIGAPYDGFARDLAALYASGDPSTAEIVSTANRHGVELG